MALAFQSTSLSGASSAATGITAQSAIRDALLAHASGAWTLVEEFDSAGSTIHWVVLKNSTGVSGVGSDFYVCIGRMASTGQIAIFLGEVYTAATHTLSTFAPYSTASSANTILADFSFSRTAGGATAAFVLGTAFPSVTQDPFMAPNVAASTMRFVTTIEKDYAIVNLNDKWWYIGALTDLITPMAGLVAATPIAMCDILNGGQGSFGSLTRHPIAAADAPLSVAYAFMMFPVQNFMTYIQRQALDTGLYGFADRFQANRVAASEVAAIMFAASYNNTIVNSAAKTGALRGKFKGIRVATGPAAALAYDTISIDGRKHLIMQDKGTPSSSEFLTPNLLSATTKHFFAIDTGVAG